MANIFNRLQFVKHEEVFSTREEAYNYLVSQEDGIQYITRPSLLAEPMVLLYGNEENPNVILAIGSVGDGETASIGNRTFFIDFQKSEEEIAELDEKIEEAIKSLTLIPIESDTLDFHSEKTEDGTYVSGDVKVASAQVISGISRDNKIKVVENEGLFLYVNVEYTNDGKLIFRVNDEVNEYSIPSVVSGEYVYTGDDAENIILTQNDGSKVKIDVGHLIDEWTVLPEDATPTPIVLNRAEVSGEPCPHGVEVWQDLLTADVRIKNEDDNILEKVNDGRELYVGGKAENIAYYKNNGDRSTVKEQLDRIKLNIDGENILTEGNDGFFASVKLDYVSEENKLVFIKTTVTGGTVTKNIELNSVEFLEDITYDPVTEEIVIRYVDNKGEHKQLRIPASFVIEEWKVDNENHSIELVKTRNAEDNKDVLTADAKIHSGDNNILEDKEHTLYVRGEADNIKYTHNESTTVKDVLDELKAADVVINTKIDDEIDRAESAEKVLTDKIGSGFTTDAHETVTYKFDQLQNQVNEEAAKLQNEIDRSTAKDTEHDGRLDAIDAEIGEGFDPRNTVRDEIENLQNEIDAVSAGTSMRLSNVINEDHSINVDTINDDNDKPTIKVLKVNLSDEVEDGKQNIIKLNNDGLYVGVDLDYSFNEEVGTNQLTFKTTYGTKVFDLQTNSVVDKIYYDPTREAIIIEYTVNGKRMPDVVVPVGDLINEWRVEDGHPNAVQLEKIRESGATQDVLKAAVVITDSHDDNILTMDDGALYVSGAEISANTAAIEQEIADRIADVDEEETRAKAAEQALGDRLTTAENDIDGLESDLREEVNSRILSDDALGIRIDQEIADREADVDAEETRAEAAETVLENKIGTGFTDDSHENVTYKFNELQTAITDEVSRAQGVEEALSGAITTEKTRAEGVESQLQTAISDEETRAEGVEGQLQTAINDEVSRATNKDEELDNKIGTGFTDDPHENVTYKFNALDGKVENEITRAKNVENIISGNVISEETRAKGVETAISGNVNTLTSRVDSIETNIGDGFGPRYTVMDAISGETSRAESVESGLQAAISAEESRAIAKEAELDGKISGITLSFEDTGSIDFTKSANNVVTADVILQGGDNIIKNVGSGLYATAHLSYDAATNKIKLTTSYGEEEYQLSAGAIIDNIYYDDTTGDLVITYTNAEGTQTVRFSVSKLFNEWEIDQNNCIGMKLYKDPPTQTGDPDKLRGEVLISNHPDNAIVLDGNHLYVSSSAMSEAIEVAECTKDELKVLEEVLIGHQIANECGSGYQYEPNANAYIISSAHSFMQADELLDKALYDIMHDWFLVGSDTPTNHVEFVTEGQNRKAFVDARLSHGNKAYGGGQEDSELVISGLTGTDGAEFTDTNVLKYVDVKKGYSQEDLEANNKYNGIYLSNIWNCGTLGSDGLPTDDYDGTEFNPDLPNSGYFN